METAPQTRRARQQVTRERILETALELFVERGFRNASLQEIAASAGYTTGAIYSNFSGKEDLFIGVFHRRTEATFVDFRRIALDLIEQGHTPGRAIAAALQQIAWGPEWDRLLWEFLGRALGDPVLREQSAIPFRMVAESVRDILDQAGVTPPVSIDHTAAAITALIQGHLILLDIQSKITDWALFSDSVCLLLKEELE
jgi:AcrR family transcriptional regulator